MTYPATIDVQTPEKIANWRPLVHWIMAIPHLIVGYVLGIVGSVVAVVAWFAILFTGKLPEGLADVQIMILRYSNRVSAYVGFLHEEYPPFDFTTSASDPGGTPTIVEIQPTLDGRNRLTCALRFIWAIPAMFWAAIIAIVGIVMWFFAFFAVLFTGRWPEGLRDWVMKSLRVSLRANAYAYLLTDEYPPFTTE